MYIDVLKIETILAEREITKAHLAWLSGISRQSISTIMKRGTCEPKTAGKLASGLGIPVGELTCRRDKNAD